MEYISPKIHEICRKQDYTYRDVIELENTVRRLGIRLPPQCDDPPYL
jgi:hypothetical protein